MSAVDTLGNLGTGYTSTIHFLSSDVQSGLPSDYTFTLDDAGTHTFSVSLKTAGSRFVSVTEVGGTITGGATVSVSLSSVSSLALAANGGAIGVVRPIAISALDDFGNVVTSYSGTVHFNSSDLSAVLPGDLTLVNGCAQANFTLFTVGTQTITATDVSTPSLTGTVFGDATPPIAKLFNVTGFPTSTAGVAQSFAVSVRDTIGQIATGYTGTIYFSSSDVQAGLPTSYTFTAADAGVHVFSATLRTAGAQSIFVRDLSGALIGFQAGISVTPASFEVFDCRFPTPRIVRDIFALPPGRTSP